MVKATAKFQSIRVALAVAFQLKRWAGVRVTLKIINNECVLSCTHPNIKEVLKAYA